MIQKRRARLALELDALNAARKDVERAILDEGHRCHRADGQ